MLWPDRLDRLGDWIVRAVCSRWFLVLYLAVALFWMIAQVMVVLGY